VLACSGGGEIVSGAQAILNTAAQHEQTSELAGIERLRCDRARATPESIGLVVIAGADAVEATQLGLG